MSNSEIFIHFGNSDSESSDSEEEGDEEDDSEESPSEQTKLDSVEAGLPLTSKVRKFKTSSHPNLEVGLMKLN